MYAQDTSFALLPKPQSALADYDFLRATYEALLRARQPDQAAIQSAFEALDAAHARLKASHAAMAQAWPLH
jgi:hypothetical protein